MKESQNCLLELREGGGRSDDAAAEPKGDAQTETAAIGNHYELFDLIDEGPTGELDGVPKEKFWDVVDQCYLCDLCYMVKCPYVPPHPWNVDFPHLMLRAKAYQFSHGLLKHPVRDRTLSSTDRNGKLATIPVVVHAVNAASRSRSGMRANGRRPSS